MANIFEMKRNIDNRARALETTRGASQNVMNFGSQRACLHSALLPGVAHESHQTELKRHQTE